MIKPGGARDLTPYGATFKQWGREPVYKHAPLQFLTWTILKCVLHSNLQSPAPSSLSGLEQVIVSETSLDWLFLLHVSSFPASTPVPWNHFPK